MKLEELGPVRTCPDLFSWFYSISISSQRFLCLSGRFRLSAITRVTAGAIPDFRAARRASLPTSMLFLFRLFIAPARLSHLAAARKRNEEQTPTCDVRKHGG